MEHNSCCHDEPEKLTHNHRHSVHNHKDMSHDKKVGEHIMHEKDHKTHGGHSGHDHHSHHEHMVKDFKKRFWISLLLTFPVLILSPLIQNLLGIQNIIQFRGDKYLLFLLSSVVFFYGALPFLRGLFQEVKRGQPGMMTLISVAISAAYFYSGAVVFGLSGKLFFWELVTLIDIMLLGHWIEMRSILGASRSLEELVKLLPAEAHQVLPDGTILDVAIENVKKGDILLVKPGEKIPTDGVVVEGESSVNEAMITGESTPVYKRPDDEVIGGSINGEGSLKIEVKKVGKDSFLSQMIALVKEAQESKSRTQDIANRAALWLTVISLSVGFITFVTWYFIVGKEFVFALERMITVMVITCPHALGLAIPLVVAVSTSLSAKNGLLIRNREAFERGRKIDVVLFDKTGTLTEGKFGVTDVILFNKEMKRDELLRYAASVEVHSQHPIAKGIVGSVKDVIPAKDFNIVQGKGVFGRVGSSEVIVVSDAYLEENSINIDSTDRELINTLAEQGKTVVYVFINKKLSGAIALADIIRAESKEAVAELKNMGIKCMMITGDNARVARWVSDEIGLDDYFAGVLPHEKLNKVKDVQSKGLTVAMTGDGVNDAPALAQADVGIAVGAGTDVAAETADIILVRSNPLDVVSILKLSKATYKKMIQNLMWATGYNVIAIPLAAGVLYSAGIVLGPALGAVLMSLSTVIVAINARFLKVER